MMNKYCKIYISSPISIEQVRTSVSGLINGERVSDSFISTKVYEISVFHNDEFDLIRQKDFPDGFLYFKYILDIDFEDSCEIDYCVNIVNVLISWFWSVQIAAVAACDYESHLFNKGGYKMEKLPWPP